ncbi:sugar phosphate isomerase/epimerase family protein [Paenibacillus aurantius]|uniref:Sugar phosphate isomerase/epimerase family protein n=1 Tax=Paenibacillus aurantius TaxID=2918900 RepID=A0AA96LFQ6_9BACL|nr:sugar phosphate isomerase/epimerase family protein [Paenibacillus aurantius]WNQ12379.1 sugar phosphate isomerase/epimerase family protein [Paenibacillus aurantius]
MKLGLSSYSLVRAIQSNEMTVLDAVDWIAENGGEHLELVPMGYTLTDNPDLIAALKKKASDAGIALSNYAIGANFIKDTKEEYEAEIARVMKEVDTAGALGLKLMRHDAGSHSDTSMAMFLKELPRLAEACARVADHAAQYGITTSVENHGYLVQASDRVQALIQAVDRPNFRTTLDVGNFMCADENSVAAVKKNIPFASMVHVKDFYLRPSYENPGQGWFRTTSGNYLRGAIVGHGDIDMREVLRTVKASGYDGYVSVEFEGMEECRTGSKIGMDNVRRIWDEV